MAQSLSFRFYDINNDDWIFTLEKRFNFDFPIIKEDTIMKIRKYIPEYMSVYRQRLYLAREGEDNRIILISRGEEERWPLWKKIKCRLQWKWFCFRFDRRFSTGKSTSVHDMLGHYRNR